MTVSAASARQTRVDQGQRTVHRCRGVRAVGLAHHHAVHHVDEQQNVGHRPAGVGQPGRLSPRSASKATAWLTPWRGVPGDLGTKGGVVTDADARVLRAYASGIAGEIPPDQALPEVWLLDDSRWDEASAWFARWLRPVERRWACPACGEIVEGPFETCWNCGADAPA